MYIVEACKQQNKRNVREQMGEKYKGIRARRWFVRNIDAMV